MLAPIRPRPTSPIFTLSSLAVRAQLQLDRLAAVDLKPFSLSPELEASFDLDRGPGVALGRYRRGLAPQPAPVPAQEEPLPLRQISGVILGRPAVGARPQQLLAAHRPE